MQLAHLLVITVVWNVPLRTLLLARCTLADFTHSHTFHDHTGVSLCELSATPTTTLRLQIARRR